MRALIFIIAFWIVGQSSLYGQTPTPAPDPPKTVDIPMPEPITVDTLKAALADASLARDSCQAYATKLRAKIIDLSDQLAKAKQPAETKK